MSIFPHTVTVYNKYNLSDTSEVWCRNVIVGVMCDINVGISARTEGSVPKDKCNLIIPNTAVSKKAFLMPKEWATKTEAERQNIYYTLDEKTLLILGDVTLTNIDISTVCKTTDNCFIISDVVNNNFGNLNNIDATAN